MKKIYTLFSFSLALSSILPIHSQMNLDTLAIQDFEIIPATPTWNFTGPVIYNAGFSSPTAAPPNSPLGIGRSRAWETTLNSGGLVLDFDNITIPVGYDSIRVHFNLASMNLNQSSGGPDNLDYVLVAYSLDNGAIYTNRLRIRGSIVDNSFWAYNATGVAKVYYLPITETMFQPTTTGLQTTFGYSNCEIVFPGSVTQVKMRLTGRSSTSTDTWLIDNLLITGENSCVHTSSNINSLSCGNFTAPSGAIYTTTGTYSDTINNLAGCDSIITINLTVNSPSSSNISPIVCDGYFSPAGNTYSISGPYVDTIPNYIGCDSVITINLTVNPTSTSNLNPVVCDSYLSPSGNIYSITGTYLDTISNFIGCDSIITIFLTVNTVNSSVNQSGAQLTAVSSTGTYQWYNCDLNAPVSGETSQVFIATVNGNYALIITDNNCTDTSSCFTVSGLSIDQYNMDLGYVYPNPVKDQCTIMLNTEYGYAIIRLMDYAGRVILQRSYMNSQQLDLNIQELPSGMYTIGIYLPNGEQTSVKMIKQ